MAAESQYRLSLASDTAAGLERGEFYLVYQPKAAADSGAIVGAEALMRWLHPQHGLVPPMTFIALAEETGAIDLLTRWALRQAIDDQIKLRAQGIDAPVSVNISARTLSDGEFCDFAVEMVRESGASVCFEITETAIIDDPVRALHSIQEFKDAGIKISIDDYGSGLSSLAYLKQIDADELKLDRGLIVDIATSLRDRLILKSTIELAHGLGLSVVAEGVEDGGAGSILAGLGCDAIQGYLISEPLPLVRFIDRFRRRNDENVVPLFGRNTLPR